MKITIRMWIMIFFILFSIISIFSIPPIFLKKGVEVENVLKDSLVYNLGLRQGMIIESINQNKVSNLQDFSEAISTFSDSFQGSETQKVTILTNSGEFIGLVPKNFSEDFFVKTIPKTRITTGLDLQGGVRALITKDSGTLSSQELEDLISVTQERLNAYGLSDVSIRERTDSFGNRYMSVEIAGSSPADIESLIAQQGKFEAKIGNETIFIGGQDDITRVGRTSAEGAGVYDCRQSQANEWFCQFRFPIYLNPEAANHYGDVTRNIPISTENPQYLEKKIDFYLDDVLTESLFISKELRGSTETQHSIQGSGSGTTNQEAFDNAIKEMKKLQTILITGSLPFKIKIEKIDRISPTLGEGFLKTIFLASLLAVGSVFIILLIKYRKIKISLTIVLVMSSEILITLGIAALIKWNIDLAGIAGIIAAIGTGVDDQIVIVDESRRGKEASLKQRIKNALFIIFTAYATAVVSLLPLLNAGAGLLAGFAFTTLIGISAGVFITRPAFADIIKQFGED